MVALGQCLQLLEQGNLWRDADTRFGQQGGGIGVRLVFIAARQARGQERRQHIGDPDADTGEDTPQDHPKRRAHGVLAGKIDHPSP